MNNVCLCIGNYAKNPFYIKLADVSLYSIEELCYYFMDRVHLVDDTIVSQELVNWIRRECGLDELANELDVYVRKHMSAASFVSSILEWTGMYDEATRKRIDHVLKEQSNLTTVQRYKKRAEYLYQQGRFRQALEIYRELIDYVPESDMSLRAVLYYNMASIYAMDFDYRQSAEYYYESYLLNPDKQTKYAYILANKLYLTDYAYGNFKRENPQWNDEFEKVEQMCIRTQANWQESREKKVVTDLMELKQEGKIDEYYQQANRLIKQLKKDYKRQTQG